MPPRSFNGLTVVFLLVGCAAPPASPSTAFQKAAPTLAEAETVSGAFVAALASTDPRAMRGFFEAQWSSQVPVPPEDEVAERAESSRQLLGPLAVRPATLTAHGASVLACAPRDGWITLDFFFEAAAPHKVLGMRARPTTTTQDAGPCGVVPEPATPADIAASLDASMAARVARVPFSGVVLVGKDGTALFAKAYGLADRATKAPNLVDTRFNIGSSSKMFTALAIEQLAGAGRLGLGDPVQRYLPDFGPRELGPATIAHLLTHTSGLGDVFRPPFFEDRSRLREPADYLRAFGAEPLEFSPGARGRYSNLGYMALGGVVERVAGESYDAYVREHVWGPAGMTDTSNTAYDAPMTNRATGYTHRILEKGAERERWTPDARPNDALNLVKGSPAACTLSTAPDLLRFAGALLAGKIVDPSTLARMTHGDVPLEAPGGLLDGRYGHGFIEEYSGGVRHFGHGGGLPGANAYFEILPEQGYTIVVLANEDPAEATWIGDRILTWIVDMLARDHR
ncbi:MAG TPA: serine hydrolase domain-containing protein [Polyangiaceae bacterium]|jgi:CubicO group peptidase (beta-lactamase class C family)|nr:serine hydrolase domain-containing protein [Polyangiaceae bacterium]